MLIISILPSSSFSKKSYFSSGPPSRLSMSASMICPYISAVYFTKKSSSTNICFSFLQFRTYTPKSTLEAQKRLIASLMNSVSRERRSTVLQASKMPFLQTSKKSTNFEMLHSSFISCILLRKHVFHRFFLVLLSLCFHTKLWGELRRL